MMKIPKSLALSAALTLLLLAACLPQPGRPPAAPQAAPAPTAPKPAVITPLHREGVDTQCSYFYFLWGKSAENNGRLDEALDAYEKAVVCDAEADYVIRNLTVLLLRLNRRQQAMDWVDKLVQAHPEDQKTILFQADLYGAMGENSKAIAIYQRLLHQAPKDPELLLRLGKQYLDTLDYLQARDCFERLVAVEPDSFVGYYYLARLYRELKFDQKAAAAYQKTIDLNWSAPLALEIADFYESRKLTDKAIELYTKLLEEDEARDEAASHLARIYLGRNQADQALALLQGLRGKSADSQRLDVSIGRILVEQRRYPEAIKLFADMLARDPDSDLARTLLAMAYYESGDREHAKAILRAVKMGDKGFDDALTLLVKIHIEDRDYHGAINLVNRAIRAAKDDDQRYRFLLSSIYEEQGKLAEAERALVEAIQRHPKSETAYFNYGMFLERQARQAEAMTQMEKILTINPDDPLALNYIGYSWAERGIRLPEALAHIQKALSQRPDDGFILDSLGWVYYHMGELAKAAEALEKAVILESDDPTIREHLGDVYLSDHKPDLALDSYRRSLELTRKDEDKARVKGKIDSIPQP